MTNRIEQLKELCAKATPGPWNVDYSYISPTYVRAENGHLITSSYVVNDETTMPYSHNTQLIAASRQAVPALIALVEEMARALEEIVKRPNLPNPERDCDWKNCMLWRSYEAREALSAYEKFKNDLGK